VRLDPPATASLPAGLSSSGLDQGRRAARKLACVAVMDAEFHPMLFGASERLALQQLADFSGPPLTAAEVARPGAHFEEVEAIIAGWGMPVLDEAVLRRFPRLRVVFYAAGTIRNIVTDASWRRGIRFTTAALANAKPVAEFTQAAIVFSLKRVWERARSLREKNLYQRHQPEIPGCYGTTVGLLALGKIGRLVAQRLREMDVHVIGYDPYVLRTDAERLGVRLCELEEVFAIADVVSCHLPLHAGTAQLLDAPLFRRMKPNATFINTARGAVVNEPDLVAVLTERTDLYAVLDTIAEEPPRPDSALLKLPNTLVTPHIAGSMCDECRRMGIMMVDELRRYVAGEPLLGEVREADLEILA
jgi:phosphoglycerate dehydrogenase-like enzyme